MKHLILQFSFLFLFLAFCFPAHSSDTEDGHLLFTNSLTPLSESDTTERRFSFGLTFGLQSFGFSIKQSNRIELYGFNKVDAIYDYGFHMGFMFNLKINNNTFLRFIPRFSVGNRHIDYYSTGSDVTNYSYRQHFDPYFLEFPILYQYFFSKNRTYKPYFIGGLKYSYDLGSFEKMEPSGDEWLLLITKAHDFGSEFGIGIQRQGRNRNLFFEIKSSVGFRNLKLPGYEGPKFYDAIDNLRSRSIMFSLIIQSNT